VIVVHVAPRGGEIAWGSGAVGYRSDPERALENYVRSLPRSFDVRLKSVVACGDVASELLEIATREAVDLIAVGAHGHGPPARVTIGAVTTRVVRCATCSVIVAPRNGVAN
jgi:nucleotide-binding universal stress UspA family protein